MTYQLHKMDIFFNGSRQTTPFEDVVERLALPTSPGATLDRFLIFGDLVHRPDLEWLLALPDGRQKRSTLSCMLC